MLGLPTSDVGRFLLLLPLLLMLVGRPWRRPIDLTTGQKVETLAVRRQGDMVMGKVQVGSGSGEVGYHIRADCAKSSFRNRGDWKTASKVCCPRARRRRRSARSTRWLPYYEPFKDVPGAWWSQAALIKVSALSALRREPKPKRLRPRSRNSYRSGDCARGEITVNVRSDTQTGF